MRGEVLLSNHHPGWPCENIFTVGTGLPLREGRLSGGLLAGATASSNGSCGNLGSAESGIREGPKWECGLCFGVMFQKFSQLSQKCEFCLTHVGACGIVRSEQSCSPKPAPSIVGKIPPP